MKDCIEKYLKERMQKHIKDGNEEVFFIQFAYSVGENGNFFYVFFETEPGSEPDGSWTTVIEKYSTTLPNTPDEKSQEIGDLIKSIAISFRDSGKFKSINANKICDFGIESGCGCYGWPIYEERGKENFIVKQYTQ